MLTSHVALQYDHRAPANKVAKDRTVTLSQAAAAAAAAAAAGREGGGGGGGEKSQLTKQMKRKKSPNLEGFNETEYVLTSRRDQDSYKLNAFNQAESDRLASDRSIPDTRHYQ